MTLIAERLHECGTQIVDRIGDATFIGDGLIIATGDSTGECRYARHGERLADEFVHLVPERTQTLVLIPRWEEFSKEIEARSELDFTCSLWAPSYVAPRGTGRSISEYLQNTWDAIRDRAVDAASTLASSAATSVALDIPTALQQARAQAGLPVQDLAAMFGVKRRQFYNLMSGEDTPDAARERRIARVTAAISQLSEQANGNSRSVRAVLLARLDGDSLYDAAVADDDDRLDLAVGRAMEAMAAGVKNNRLPRSGRASSAEAAAVREFLSATRDDTDTSQAS
jgi:transcriptional regulator with XRE-family HTH domain